VKGTFRHAADLLTGVRLLATLPLVVFVLEERYESAFWLFVVAGATDIADGLVARWVNQPTTLGAFLDPVADKVFLGSMFVVLGIGAAIPLWLVAIVIFRDAAIGAGTIALRLRLRQFRVEPLVAGKLCTLAQMLCIGFVLGALAHYVEERAFVDIAIYGALAMTIASGIAYLGTAYRLQGSAPAT